MTGATTSQHGSTPNDSDATPRRRSASADWWWALLAGVVAGVVYLLGAAPDVLFGDSGELQFAAWTAGLPHPTGYPLYILAGWAWSHALAGLGLASPARAMTLFSALFGAVAVALTYLLTRTLVGLAIPQARVIVARLAALLAALTFAFIPTLWSQAVIAEVYTLHATLVALVLWLALLWRAQDARSPSPSGAQGWWPGPVLAALGLAVGLGLAHHRTTLLLLPVLLVYLWLSTGGGYWLRRWRWLVVMGLLMATPLLLYLVTPWQASHTPYLAIELRPGQIVSLIDRSPAGLANYLLGRGFAGDLQGAAALVAAPRLPARFAAELTPVGVILAFLGVIVLASRRQWSLLWLTGGSFASLVAFNLVYTIGDIAVFYIPAYLIACAWISVAAGWMGSLGRRPHPLPASPSEGEEIGLLPLRGGLRSGEGVKSSLALSFLFVLPIYLFVANAAALDRSADTRARDWWDALLAAGPPQSAVLVSNDRDEMMPLWYMQQVEGARPDLAGVFPLLLSEPGWANVGQVVDSALATGRPVLLIKPMPGLEIKAQLGPSDASGLTPVLGPAVAGPPAHAESLAIGDVVRLAGYDIQPEAVQPGQAVQIDLYWQPLHPLPGDYTSFVQLLAPDGSKVAQSDHPVGGVYYPTSLWQPGEVLLDRHVLHIPAGAPPGPLQVYLGMYQVTGSELNLLGAGTLAAPIPGPSER